MKFGSDEWFRELNKRTKFPVNFAFYYNKRDDKIMISKIVSSTTNPDNVKFKSIKPITGQWTII